MDIAVNIISGNIINQNWIIIIIFADQQTTLKICQHSDSQTLLIVIEPDGTIVMVNTSFEQLTGYKAEDIIGKPCTVLGCDACELGMKSAEDKSWWCAMFGADNPGIRQCRCNLIKKDGTYMPALKSATVLRDEHGTPLGAVETITDVSELHRLDQEVALLSRQLYSEDGFYGIIGTSPVMQKVFDIILKVGTSDTL